LLQRDQVHNSSKEPGSEDAGTESEYNNSDNDDDAADSNDDNSVMPPRRPRKEAQIDKMKDARELFSWKGDQKTLAIQLWLALDNGNCAA
jgi:hypothetical protein